MSLTIRDGITPAIAPQGHRAGPAAFFPVLEGKLTPTAKSHIDAVAKAKALALLK